MYNTFNPFRFRRETDIPTRIAIMRQYKQPQTLDYLERISRAKVRTVEPQGWDWNKGGRP